MKTYIIFDTKLIAYNACLHRHKGIIEALDMMNNIVRYLKDNSFVDEYEVILTYDYEKSRHREVLLGSYKGHRTHGLKEKPKEVQEEYDKFQKDYRHVLPELTKSLGIRTIGVSRVEADDLMSILANQLQHKVIIITEDRDLNQVPLANPGRVSQFYPKTYRMMTADTLIESEGVNDKEEFLVKKAVLGDTGDGIMGIAQCGKVCFNTWFEPLKGLGSPLSLWKENFCSLAKSNKKFNIHSKYTNITSFEDLFDLNIALGETMVDCSHFNEEELNAYISCLSVSLEFNKDNYLKVYNDNCEPSYNDFGDQMTPDTFEYLRGI